jgi:hypothetical protein
MTPYGLCRSWLFNPGLRCQIQSTGLVVRSRQTFPIRYPGVSLILDRWHILRQMQFSKGQFFGCERGALI